MPRASCFSVIPAFEPVSANIVWEPDQDCLILSQINHASHIGLNMSPLSHWKSLDFFLIQKLDDNDSHHLLMIDIDKSSLCLESIMPKLETVYEHMFLLTWWEGCNENF